MSRIPKTVHFIWLGKGEKPPLVKMCLESWEKAKPQYEIIEWNEDNLGDALQANEYIKEAYAAKKWAFVSDYIRLYILYHNGGIYCDTDVELLKPLDDSFLENEAFSGFESRDSVPTGIMAAEKGSKIIEHLLSYYEDKHFINSDGSYNMITNVVTITNMLTAKGLTLNGKEQIIDGFAMYPQIYFCPNNFSRIFNKPSKKSYTIHHFAGSWTEDCESARNIIFRIRRWLVGVLRTIIGSDRLTKLKG